MHFIPVTPTYSLGIPYALSVVNNFTGGSVVFNRTRVLALEGDSAEVCVMLQSASLDRDISLELQSTSDTAMGK